MRLKQFDGVTQYCLNLCCDALRYVLKDSVKVLPSESTHKTGMVDLGGEKELIICSTVSRQY